jgi:penicillin-binding protein 1A
MGYTGNFVCGVWMGNDDYTSTNRMTGGSLPAMTWHSIMEYAHQGIELKPLPGIPVPTDRKLPVFAAAKPSAGPPPPPRPVMLTKRGAGVLANIERMMEAANRTMPPLPTTISGEKKKQAEADADKGGALAAALEGRAFERN